MNKQVIIRNNAVSIIVHTLLCTLTYVLFNVPTPFNHEAILTISFFISVLLAILNPWLYFLCGRRFLRNTQDRKQNILSVASLPIFVIIFTIIPNQLLNWINAPFAILVSFIGHSVGVTGYLILALLPSAVLYSGMIVGNKE